MRDWLLKDVPTNGWLKYLITAQHTTGPTASKTSSTTSGPAGAARAINASSTINPDSTPQFAVAGKLSDETGWSIDTGVPCGEAGLGTT
jgi:hypothetical protein